MLKVILASLGWFYAVLIDDISFSGFLDLFNAIFKDNKSVFLFWLNYVIYIFLHYLLFFFSN